MPPGNNDNSINSPPYPSFYINSDNLFRMLAQLRLWLVAEQEIIRDLIKRRFAEQLKEPDNMPDILIWNMVSVSDKNTVLHYLRIIRESWDTALREHEDAWDSTLALKRRHSVLMLAQSILQEAFTNPEVREMKQQRAADEIRRNTKTFNETLRKMTRQADDDVTEEESWNPPDEEAGGPEDENDEWFSEDEEPRT